MSDTCYFLNPLRRDGTSQRQRMLEALRPSYVSIDERSTADLLLYVRNYAELLQYYTETNTVGGNWVEFLQNDVSVVVAIISDIDRGETKKQFSHYSKTVQATDLASKPQALMELFEFMFSVLLTIDSWYRRAVAGLGLYTSLVQYIHSVLNDSLRDLIAIAKQANIAGINIVLDTSLYSDIWELENIEPDNAFFVNSPLQPEDFDEAMVRINEVFNRSLEVYNKIIEQAPDYLDETLEKFPQHEPHVSLLLAFVLLLKYAQEQLNTLTGKHLNFYYEEVLQLTRKPATADQVHIIFELAKRMTPERVKQDTKLKAKDNQGKELLYATDSEIVVNHALINTEVGLKSLYVDKYYDETADHFKDQVINIYAATDADSADGLGAEIVDEEGKWLTFGGTTMPYASIGFAIASPMFFLAEGDRKITLRLYLSKKPAYFTGPAKTKAEQELQYNVKVSATGSEDWLDLEVTAVTLATEGTKAFIEYTLSADAGQPAIIRYSAKLHGYHLESEYPLVRLMLDNTGLPASNEYDLADTAEISDYSDEMDSYAKGELVRYDGQVYLAIAAITQKGYRPDVSEDFWLHIPYAYPYQYFQNQQLKKIHISTAVQGVRNLILENDIGVLNPAKPFHPFSTVPKAKSSLFIGSNEIFNKPLNELNIKLEWVGLPEVNFSEHYSEYKIDTNGNGTLDQAIVDGNDYFYATAYLLKNGNWHNINWGNLVGKEPDHVLDDHTDNVWYADFSPDNKFVATGSRDKTVKIWNADTGALLHTLGEKSKNVSYLKYSPDGRKLAHVSNLDPNTPYSPDFIIRIWDLSKMTFNECKGHTRYIHSVEFDPDGGKLISASYDTTARIWDVKTGSCIKTISYSGIVKYATFSPDGKYFATALWGQDYSAYIYEAKSGNLLYRLAGHTDSVFTLSFSSDSKLVVTTSLDNTAVVWSVENGHKVHILSAHSKAVIAGSFSPDNTILLTASRDYTACLWDVESGKLIVTLEGHTSYLEDAVFSPDGKMIGTAASDKTAKIWNLDGELLQTLEHDGTYINHVFFSSDKRKIITVSSDKKARIWSIGKIATLFIPSGSSEPPQDQRSLRISFNEGELAFNPELETFTRFNTALRHGFFRIELSKSFLQELYPKLVAAAAKEGELTMPNPPYVPMLSSLSLDYAATQTVLYEGKKLSDYKDRVEQLFHLCPFGNTEVYPITDQSNAGGVLIDRHLVPHFPVTVQAEDESSQERMTEGTLYIGIEQLQPPQNLSVLFQVAEGSEAKKLSAQQVAWSYLSNNRWVYFRNDEIIVERTNGLLTSGIVEFAMPKLMTNTDTILPAATESKLHWIKASVYRDSAAVCKLIALHSQAVLASFRDNDNDPTHLQTALAAQKISKLKSRIAAIKSVSQPYASFGGKMAESDTEFQVRVSERLRHKGKAVTIFDYERLVLEKFPEVYKVKCINHTSPQYEYSPGHVKLIVVPDLRNKNAVDPFEPLLSLNKRESIRKYLIELASDFVHIDVYDPQYEKIQVEFQVRFKAGVDKGFYKTLLNKDIIKFLSPWLYDEGADLQFGGLIHRSVILKYIEDRSYVEFVTEFKMNHIIDDLVMQDIEIAYASTSSSVLVSVNQHNINPDAASCEDKQSAGVSLEGEDYSHSETGDVIQKAYLGNRRKREMHDLANITGACQIDEIAEKWRLYFSSKEEGLKMGYDYCAFCFGRILSKR